MASTEKIRSYLEHFSPLPDRDWATFVSRLEERVFTAPEALPVYLRRFGYGLEEDAGAADYRQRYLPERKNLLKG